ncbi:MAG TPA: hypothetical protein ACFYD2_03555 [Candidatus Avalokitesvara rifleensis]|uniref:hypothetical protein n=1 Tax=Candidatus Avalokitesvara rifleensis TaxID=3367620 RepID=UPI002712FFC5|nr:hypothetical protein [Candidatus Brocadiales bacterium]
MKLEEQDSEAKIIKKLEDIEKFLKSFVASLDKPSQKLIREKVPVKAPIEGEIKGWYFVSGDYIERKGIPLGGMTPDEEGSNPWDFHDILSPAEGYLQIRVAASKKVSKGYEIGYIELPGVPV